MDVTAKPDADLTQQSFRDELALLLKARFPVVYIESFEEERVIADVSAVAASTDYVRTPRHIYLWSQTSGFAKWGEKGKSGTEKPAQGLAAAMAVNEPSVMVFRDLHSAFGDEHRPADPEVVRRLRDIAVAFRKGAVARTLIIVSPVLRIPPELEKDITLAEFRLPHESEIRALLKGMIGNNAASGALQVKLDDLGLEKLAKAAHGLTLTEAENAFAKAMADDGVLDENDVELVLTEKRQAVRKSGLMEALSVDIDLDDVGGLENLKRWLAKRNGSWLDDARYYGLPAPKGVLITGVPGCGKSLTAKAVAAAWGLPLLRLDIGKVFSGLVGSSEQNMRTAIRTAEAIAPCVLWIDEVEKGFAGMGGGGDSGTSSRVFGSFLSWMQEKTTPVFVIATANNIDNLPPEFLRKGRFDEIFFVDLPTQRERESIWAVHLGKRLGGTPAGTNLDDSPELRERLSAASEGFSGAEIENAVTAAMFEGFDERRGIEEADLMRALEITVPLSVTGAERINTIREWANTRAVAATAQADRAEPASGPALDEPREVPPPSQSQPLPGNDGRGGRTIEF